MEQPTNTIDTWAIVEIMGHTKLAGHVKTEAFGSVCMLRVDVPELPEKREQETTRWNYDTGERYEQPQLVERIQPAEAAYTRYFGLQAVFSLTPCDQATAIGALERMRKTPAKLLRLGPAPAGALPEPVREDLDESAEDDFDTAMGPQRVNEEGL